LGKPVLRGVDAEAFAAIQNKPPRIPVEHEQQCVQRVEMFRDLRIVNAIIMSREIPGGTTELPGLDGFYYPCFCINRQHPEKGVSGLAGQDRRMTHGCAERILKLGKSLFDRGKRLEQGDVFLVVFQVFLG
jgi:hypothetical protein